MEHQRRSKAACARIRGIGREAVAEGLPATNVPDSGVLSPNSSKPMPTHPLNACRSVQPSLAIAATSLKSCWRPAAARRPTPMCGGRQRRRSRRWPCASRAARCGAAAGALCWEERCVAAGGDSPDAAQALALRPSMGCKALGVLLLPLPGRSWMLRGSGRACCPAQA